ncbi:ROK family protein [Nocardioides sp. BP30]|uniref:ROK family protein n=1 Tax=Nocardioides sp. BP30 TaxID=3036374 RepID=UPI0024688F3E|nr:ROK family protein [Nocardioides sp. BP30]WGL52399.1 ROK family protein [Nocardioides sp. BP30]
MVRLKPGEPRPSATTRRADLPRRRGSARGAVPDASILRAVLDHGPVARSNIARLTGTSAASVSGVSGSLLEAGLLREVPEAAGPPGYGRPHVPLDIEVGAQVVLAVHFAVAKATVAALDLRGRVLSSEEMPYDRPAAHDAVAAAAQRIHLLRARYGDRRVLGLGAAVGGWVDPERGVVVDNPMLGWREVPLRDLLQAATGLPTFVENHGRALLGSERLFGAHAARARESILHLFVGNLVDASFALHGGVHQGRRAASGNLAHLPVDADPGWCDPCSCGRAGCFPAAVSEQALIRRAADLGVRARLVTELTELARAGDERLVGLFIDRARVVGHAVAYLLDLFNPEVLILTEAGFLWVPPAREALLAEVAARSAAHEDAGEVIAPPSAEEFLALAAGTALLDRVYAAPLAVMGDLRSVAGTT